MNGERCLVIVPIMHTAADMMSLMSAVPHDKTDEALALARWEKVGRYLEHWPSRLFKDLRVYQDGLPDTSTDNLLKIIARAETVNYDILRWLERNGAVLMGTESVPLLVEEYNHRNAIFRPSEEEEQWAQAVLNYYNRKDQLLVERDLYIAQRIDNTLLPGGLGLLFIGLAHQVRPLLVNKMVIKEPKMFCKV